MDLRRTLPLLAVLLLLPASLAHSPRGTPKDYCEPWDEWFVHEYGPPATGRLLQGFEDGNVQGDCDGQAYVSPYVDLNDPLASYVDVNLPFADYDGHAEYARGGAWILSGLNAGYCFGEEAHHPAFPWMEAHDLTWAADVHFTVVADLDGGSWDVCGDFEAEWSQHCVDACFVPVPPGADGSYIVYVGHVEAPLPSVHANLPTQGHVFAY